MSMYIFNIILDGVINLTLHFTFLLIDRGFDFSFLPSYYN